ncbi:MULTISPECIES: hypothetical protein [unclassified Saccharothrix]|uniref:hypothetical protein n=1 Tax=unclassified Saccharothrix TaxID=2593673 RepID=UPI00307E3325
MPVHLFRNTWALSPLATDFTALDNEVVELGLAHCDGADSSREAVIHSVDRSPGGRSRCGG